MFGIALIKSLADWQPHVNENDYAAEHVRPVQTGDGEVTGKIGAMPWTKRIYPLNVFLLNRRDMVGRRNVKEMWPIVRRIVRIHINRIKTDFVFLDVRVLERFRIVQVTTDLDPRLHPLFGSATIAEVLLV